MLINKKNKTGFTLIELLVVIAIIALLMAVVVPSLKRAKDIAKRVVCASRLRQIGVAMTNYSQSYDELPDSKDIYGDPEFGHGYALYRGGDNTGAGDDEFKYPSGKLIPLRWAKLYEGGYMDVPEIFYCPANRLGSYKYESYVNPSPWGTLPQNYNTTAGSNQWVRMGYTYFPIPSTRPEWSSGRMGFAEKFIQLNSSLPYATDILHGRSNLSHQRAQNDDDTYKESNKYSVNALYSDAHVSNCNDPDVFSNTIWDQFHDDQVTYDEYYYAVFKLIGAR